MEQDQTLATKAILDRRMISDGTWNIDQVLIHWDGSVPEDTLGRLSQDLEEKVLVEDRRVGTNHVTVMTGADFDSNMNTKLIPEAEQQVDTNIPEAIIRRQPELSEPRTGLLQDYQL